MHTKTHKEKIFKTVADPGEGPGPPVLFLDQTEAC